MAMYVQSSGTHQTSSASYVPIPGLSLNIPEGVGVSALVIVNLPLPYATGNDFPGGNIGVSVNGTVLGMVGGFTYNESTPQSTGRVPTTLVVSVPLINSRQTVEAVW